MLPKKIHDCSTGIDKTTVFWRTHCDCEQLQNSFVVALIVQVMSCRSWGRPTLILTYVFIMVAPFSPYSTVKTCSAAFQETTMMFPEDSGAIF
jgi:hypothetical protein